MRESTGIDGRSNIPCADARRAAYVRRDLWRALSEGPHTKNRDNSVYTQRVQTRNEQVMWEILLWRFFCKKLHITVHLHIHLHIALVEKFELNSLPVFIKCAYFIILIKFFIKLMKNVKIFLKKLREPVLISKLIEPVLISGNGVWKIKCIVKWKKGCP